MNHPPARTPKQDAAAMIAALPDDASMAEIVYRLHVIQRIREGLEDIEAGRTVPHEAALARLAKWREA